MGLIDSLRQSLNNYRTNLAAEQSKVTEYQAKVDEIQEIYDEMKEKKKSMKNQKKEMQNLVNEEYTNWKGTLFSESKEKMQSQIIDGGYKTIISEIDTNLDALRDKKTSFENKILSSKGIIGSLEASINSIGNSIAKLLN